MKTARFVLCLMCCLSILHANAQIKRLDNSRLTDVQVTSEIQKIVENAKIAGLAVVIINENRIVYENYFGVKNLDTKEKIDKQTAFYAASFTKPLFTYAFLKLVEKNVFDLDTPLYTYLKKPIGDYERWKDLANAPDFVKITPRMILCHSAGLPVLRSLYNNGLPILAPPGTRLYYSNEGMNLLGFVVEERTGQRLENLVADSVYKPLGMQRSCMIWNSDFDSNFAVGHDMTGKTLEIEKRTNARAAGSMTTTASDYAQLVIACMKQQGLSSRLFKEMMRPQIAVESERGFGPKRSVFNNRFASIKLSWGLGWGLFQSKVGQAFFHGGHTDGWQNYAVAYPKKKIAVVLMSNSDNFEPVADKILNMTIRDTQSPLEWFGYFDRP